MVQNRQKLNFYGPGDTGFAATPNLNWFSVGSAWWLVEKVPVEAIVVHRRRTATDIQYQVRWLDPPDVTWEPLAHLRGGARELLRSTARSTAYGCGSGFGVRAEVERRREFFCTGGW